MDAADLVLQLFPEPPVERAERLVHQHELGLEHERPRDGHPLLLAARELARPPVLQPLEPHELQGAADPLLAEGGVEPPHLERERQVLAHAHVREQRVVLEHHADAPPPGRHLAHGPAVDADRARGRLLEAGEHHQARGLARPGGAEQGEELALPDGQVEVADDLGPPVEALGDPLELDVGGTVGRPAFQQHLMDAVPCGTA